MPGRNLSSHLYTKTFFSAHFKSSRRGVWMDMASGVNAFCFHLSKCFGKTYGSITERSFKHVRLSLQEIQLYPTEFCSYAKLCSISFRTHCKQGITIATSSMTLTRNLLANIALIVYI